MKLKEEKNVEKSMEQPLQKRNEPDGGGV